MKALSKAISKSARQRLVTRRAARGSELVANLRELDTEMILLLDAPYYAEIGLIVLRARRVLTLRWRVALWLMPLMGP
jgi:hypothetical protein